MWRFILISFAFLGWSFYELSGGADYAPVTNSIQVRAQLDNARPKARPLKVDVTRVAASGDRAEGETVTRSITSLADLDLSNGQRFEIRLARVDSPAKAKPPELAKAVAREQAMRLGRGGVTLEEVVRSVLEPILREWLDQHLANLIERLVREEIEKMVERAEHL